MESPDMAEKSKLVDLKRSKAEKKERREAITAMPHDGEDYSYGTRLHLGEDELSKLGHEENPEVGTEHHMFVKGKVTHSSHDQDEGGEPRRSVTIQLTHMSPMKQAGSETKPEKSVRDDIKDSVRSSEEKSVKKAEVKSEKNEQGEGK
jgi:hypothetical protein